MRGLGYSATGVSARLKKPIPLLTLIALTLMMVFVSAPASAQDMKDHGAMQAAAEDVLFDRDGALKISQAAIGRTLSDFEFTNSRDEKVKISDYRGKPLVISLIYTSCAHTCPLITESLDRSVNIARDALGADSFEVVTIGFDVKVDTPRQMKAYGHAHGVSPDEWGLLSTDEATIKKISEELGFIFAPAPHGFEHLAQTTVIDEEGVVYRHIYGADVRPPVLVEPLKQLVFGRKSGFSSFSGLVNQVKLFCTIYNPASDHYRFDYSFLFSIVIGLACLIVIGVFLVRQFLRKTS